MLYTKYNTIIYTHPNYVKVVNNILDPDSKGPQTISEWIQCFAVDVSGTMKD